MSHSLQETEIKLAVRNAAAARRLLRRAGFEVVRPRVFEANTVFDTPERKLRARGELLRVREAGKVVTTTFKGRPAVARHKTREELEFTAGNAERLKLVLNRLGYQPVFRYEKYRTEYRRPRVRGLATLDVTPIGTFLELEGTPAWIDRTAQTLGFIESDYITASYGRLYEQWCEVQGVALGDMVFA